VRRAGARSDPDGAPERGPYYGWVVVAAAAACAALSSPGQSFVLSLYLEHFSADLALSRADLSSLYAVATLGAAAALPVAGRLADRVPSRRFLGGVLLLLAAACVGMATVRGALGLGLALFALRLLAQGAIGLGTITATVRWFRRYRGRALAIASLGYSAGEMVFPSLVLALVGAVGWRGSWLVFAAAYAGVLAPAAALVLRERDPRREPMDGVLLPAGRPSFPRRPPLPAAVDAAPPGGSLDDGPHAHVAAAERPPQDAELEISLHQALRLPVFWGVLLCVAVSPLVMTGVIFHQVGLFASRGWPASAVPPAFLCFAVAGVAATYTTGLLVERVPTRFALAAGLLLLALALGTLWLPLPAPPAALVYGTVLGLAGGVVNAANAALWPDYFGVAALGSIKGVDNAVRNGATAVGPALVAALVSPGGSVGGSPDGSFNLAVGVLAGVALVGSVAVLACRPPQACPPPSAVATRPPPLVQ